MTYDGKLLSLARAALEKEQNDIERKLFEDYALSRREAMEAAPEIESVPKAQKRLTEPVTAAMSGKEAMHNEYLDACFP